MTPLEMAVSQIGYTESPPNSNRTKYGRWFGMDAVPWCMEFVQWCYDSAGYPLPYKTASCSALFYYYKEHYPERLKREAKPNDIVIYNFGHTGIVESAGKGYIYAIEGNTSPDNTGSQNDGGGVYRRRRSMETVQAFIRPYDFTEDEMTQEKFNEMMDVYLSELAKKPPSAWSADARQWAESNGVINGDGKGNMKYKSFCTREELVQILFNINNKEIF